MNSRQIIILFLSTLLGSFGAFSATAKPLTFGDKKGHLTVPDDWTIKQMSSGSSGYAASATDTQNTESLSIFVVATQSSGPLDENSSYVKGFLKTCADNKAVVTGHARRSIAGTDFYVLTIKQELPSITLNAQVWIGVAEGQIFQFAFYSKNGDPEKNADYQSIIKSFSPADS